VKMPQGQSIIQDRHQLSIPSGTNLVWSSGQPSSLFGLIVKKLAKRTRSLPRAYLDVGRDHRPKTNRRNKKLQLPQINYPKIRTHGEYHWSQNTSRDENTQPRTFFISRHYDERNPPPGRPLQPHWQNIPNVRTGNAYPGSGLQDTRKSTKSPPPSVTTYITPLRITSVPGPCLPVLPRFPMGPIRTPDGHWVKLGFHRHPGVHLFGIRPPLQYRRHSRIGEWTRQFRSIAQKHPHRWIVNLHRFASERGRHEAPDVVNGRRDGQPKRSSNSRSTPTHP